MPKPGGKLAKGQGGGGPGGKGSKSSKQQGHRKQPAGLSGQRQGVQPASASPGIRKGATKHTAHSGGKKQAGGNKKQAGAAISARPPSAARQQSGARALTQGLGLSAAGLSALLDETVDQLKDKGIRTATAKGGKVQQQQASGPAGAGSVDAAMPASPPASSSGGHMFGQLGLVSGGAAAPPPTPAAPGLAGAAHQQPAALAALAGLRGAARERHDPAAVLESLSGWGLSG
ncbi:hypothetical protein HYH02_007777 [Chlamydomonas schloesseri]|uniref:Uncharacterized protein n=1 Tax=Chlamydomonas schloesseri TaxID=2026947 RepID=A0A835WHI6_9CHLO|nr:hypothetical protein HYH02_007777 [Chlamydomonas schloesseri]|eukprot:KAG2447453.1 hypothetical protein HYH02_007777 [Chlamydomonas schloesseri]